MKKSVCILLFVGMTLIAAITAGCSKREQTLAGVSAVSGIGAGASLLKGHFERSKARKRRKVCLKRHAHYVA